jgi:anti-anti-sigma factor
MGQQLMSVTVIEDEAVVTLRGEHEAYTADKLAKQVSALVDEGLAVTVDLSGADFVDSTVVGVLFAVRGRAGERGTEFRLLLGEETGWPVRRILEVTGLVDTVH